MTDDLATKILDELVALRRSTDRLDAKVDTLDAKVDTLDAKQEELHRYFGVVSESLRSDIQQVAEGVALTNERLDRHQEENTREFSEVRSMIRLSYSELERRIRTLEEHATPN